MYFCVKVCVSMLAIAALLGLAGTSARAQDKQHVVSLKRTMNKDAASAGPKSARLYEEGRSDTAFSDRPKKSIECPPYLD